MSDSSPRIYFPATPREREILSYEPEEPEEEEEEVEQQEEEAWGRGVVLKLSKSTFSFEIHVAHDDIDKAALLAVILVDALKQRFKLDS